MFWNFPTMHSLKFYACISVYTYTLITILLELRKLWFSKDFTMDLKGKNPGGHWWKWERLKLGTLEKELSDLNISNRIYNQTFICFIFSKNITKSQPEKTKENERHQNEKQFAPAACTSHRYFKQYSEKPSAISTTSSQGQSWRSKKTTNVRSFASNWTTRQDSGRSNTILKGLFSKTDFIVKVVLGNLLLYRSWRYKINCRRAKTWIKFWKAVHFEPLSAVLAGLNRYSEIL